MPYHRPPISTFLATAVAVVVLSTGSIVFAQGAGDGNLKISGFISMVGGQVIEGKLDGNYSGNDPINLVACPCYIADWSNAGIYNKDFSLRPESHAGIQLNYKLTPETSLAGQVVVRGTNGTPDITWAYAGYKLSKNLELQVGRKRIPLYYYSDFQDIGVSYPWVSPPPELYGWDATNYNGASMRYTGGYGETNVTSSLFAGSEDIDKSRYWKVYNADNLKVTWNNILGADIDINHGPLTMRGVYMTSDVTTRDNTGSMAPNDAKLTAYGLALNLDMDSWFMLSEFSKLTRESSTPGYSYEAPAASIGAGVRLGKWTPFINFAQYVESSSDVAYVPGSFNRTSATLRYDVDTDSAVKLQLDRNVDTTSNLGGTVTVFRISYDRVF